MGPLGELRGYGSLHHREVMLIINNVDCDDIEFGLYISPPIAVAFSPGPGTVLHC